MPGVDESCLSASEYVSSVGRYGRKEWEGRDDMDSVSLLLLHDRVLMKAVFKRQTSAVKHEQ